VAKEYLACQRDHDGVLILSEFAGAAEELADAILVNPYDAQAVAEKLGEALAMSAEEKRTRSRLMRERVMKFDAQHWARAFIQQLTTTDHAPTAASEDPREASVQLRGILANAKRVALFLDYDGTLREIEREPRNATPTPQLRALLEALVRRQNVDVFLVSGRSHQDLEFFFPQPDFACVAEHGAAIRRVGHHEWERWDRDVSYAWKDEIRQILRLYEQSTPGSWIEEKQTSLVWHHRKTDPEFGTWKAHQLTHELGTMMANEPVKIRQGRKIVEVTSSEVSKGVTIRRLLHEGNYDAVLCAGDDQTDENMFEVDASNFVAIKIGIEPSRAKYRLPDPAAFRKFLSETFIGTAVAPVLSS